MQYHALEHQDVAGTNPCDHSNDEEPVEYHESFEEARTCAREDFNWGAVGQYDHRGRLIRFIDLRLMGPTELPEPQPLD